MFQSAVHHRDLHAFPTRRSSDLIGAQSLDLGLPPQTAGSYASALGQIFYTGVFPGNKNIARILPCRRFAPGRSRRDRKSTRLNSSHVSISYAVFCLKKKNNMTHE